MSFGKILMRVGPNELLPEMKIVSSELPHIGFLLSMIIRYRQTRPLNPNPLYQTFQLPHLVPGDPRLGQSAHPQQVSQIACVNLRIRAMSAR
jgi:hypothetical protein